MNIKQRFQLKKINKLFNEEQYDDVIALYEEIGIENLDYNNLLRLGLAYIYVDAMYQAKDIFLFLENKADSLFLYNCLFVISEWEGKIDDARLYLEKGLSYDNISADFYLTAAMFYDRLEEKDKAIKYYLKTLELNPHDYWANVNLGSIFEEDNRNEEALELFKRAYKVNPDESGISYNLAVVYTKLAEFNLAEKFYLEELTNEDAFIKTYCNLGLLYMNNLQDYEQAKKYFQTGLKLYPDEYDLWYNLACLYAIIHDFKNATECFLYLKYQDFDLMSLLTTDSDLVEYRKTAEYKNNFSTL